MCGRYASAKTDVDLIAGFGVDEVVGPEPEPSWNVAPTDARRVVVERPPRREVPATPEATIEVEPGADALSVVRQLRTMRWGLVPSWADSPAIGSRMINARVETLTSKPAFRTALSRRRVLVPADGYYEWQQAEGTRSTVKRPFFLHAGREGLAFAGLYELWRDPARAADDPERWLWTYTIITRSAPDALGHIHDRTPVLVPPALRDAWLDPTLTDSDRVSRLLAAMPEPRLEPYEVRPLVNKVANNGPELVEPLGTGEPEPHVLPLSL